jgi:hypothetical protein
MMLKKKGNANSTFQQQPQQRPNYGAQVTVMSEHEKNMMKQQRKEMKKRAKMNDEETQKLEASSILGFDTEHLIDARETELSLAASSNGLLNPVYSFSFQLKDVFF